MNDDNRNSEIEAQAFFDSAYRKAEEKYGRRAAGLGWLRHIRADIGHRRGRHWGFMQENFPDWYREPVPEQSEGIDQEPGQTVRTVIHNAVVTGLILAGDLTFLELGEYGIAVVGSFGGEALEQGAEAYSKAIGTIYHTGYDDDDTTYKTLLQMSEEDQLREKESLPLNGWVGWGGDGPDEEAARRHGRYVQYSRKGFRYVERPDDGSVPPPWVDVED